jgi:hypothetical protein
LLQNGHAVEDNSGTRFGPGLGKLWPALKAGPVTGYGGSTGLPGKGAAIRTLSPWSEIAVGVDSVRHPS